MKQQPKHLRRDDLPAPQALESDLNAVLEAARQQGASAAEASLSAGRALTVSVRRGEVDSVEFQSDRELAVTVYRGQRVGSASTSDLSRQGMLDAVTKAAAIARHTGEDPWAGLADPELMATRFPDLELDHPWPLEVDDAVTLARNCEAAAFAVDDRIGNSEGADLDTRREIGAYANSHGFFGWRRASDHGLSCAVIAGEGSGMVRDYWYTTARDPADLDEAAAVGRRAGERAVARLRPRTPATTRAPVLLPPELARSLFGHFLGAISGGALYRRASFLLDAVGETVFAPQVQLLQRPHLKKAMASAAFDAEGVATADRELIRDGVLQGYLLSSYSARRLGLETTGNAGGVFNLCVEGGEGDLAGLMQQMKTGLLVTELMGQGVSLITGDYSRGAAGFWVENGEIAYPVENVTIAGNLKDMFRGIAAFGADIDTRSGIRAPSVLLEPMTIAGS